MLSGVLACLPCLYHARLLDAPSASQGALSSSSGVSLRRASPDRLPLAAWMKLKFCCVWPLARFLRLILQTDLAIHSTSLSSSGGCPGVLNHSTLRVPIHSCTSPRSVLASQFDGRPNQRSAALNSVTLRPSGVVGLRGTRQPFGMTSARSVKVQGSSRHHVVCHLGCTGLCVRTPA